LEKIKIIPKFTSKQELALRYLFDNKTTEVCFGGGAGGGKSFLGVAFCLISCIKYSGIRVMIGRSKLDALKKTTLNTYYDLCKLWNIKADTHYKFNGQSNIITFYNGSEIILKDLFHYPSDPNYDSLGSLEVTSVFIDEASEVGEKAKQICASRIRYKLDEYDLIPKMLITCNPSKNWIYTEFYKKSKEGKLPPYRKFIQALANDNMHISKHYIGQLEKLDEISKQRLLLGNWEYDTETDSLIKYDMIINLFTNTVDSSTKYITSDIARYGDDKSVIMLWHGLQVKKIYTINKNSITEIAQKIKEIQFAEQVHLSNIIVDSDGVGGGAKDILNCKGFVNNAVPINRENYKNLKTQCYYILAEKINAGLIGIECNDITVKKKIIEELEQVRRKDIDKDTKLSIISKDVIKNILGRSPDYADSLMMRMYYECNRSAGKYYIN
jgi:hypothetical protein